MPGMSPRPAKVSEPVRQAEARLARDGLGRSVVADVLNGLSPAGGDDALDADPPRARLLTTLAHLQDPRAAFDRLGSLYGAALRDGDRAEQRALLVALSEYGGMPDFDVDLLRPWLAPYADIVSAPRSLREEAGHLMLLFATGADEAERAQAAGRCMTLLKSAPPGLDWALAALCLLLNAVFARDMGMADWLLRHPASAGVSRLLDTLRALRWYETLADWHYIERRTADSIAANRAAAERADADGLPERARSFRIGIAMAFLGEKQVVEARAAIADYSPLPDAAPAVQAVYAAGNLGWLARLERRWVDSETHCRRAAELAHYAGMPALEQGVVMLQHARALLALGRMAEVLAVFDRAAPLMQGRWVGRVRADRLLVEGLQQLEAGRPAEAERLVRAGLDDHFGQSAPALLDQTDEAAARVVALGLAMGVHTEALRSLVAQRGLAPPPDADAQWPWTLRLRVFDGWQVEGLACGPGDTRQKADSKPTQVLQFLAAHAPAAVPAQRLADALWPESEGDKAMRSLDVALTRLRATLPDPALLQRNEGRVALDSTRVWCDTAAALQLAQQLREQARAKPTPEADAAQARRALQLLAVYRGPLLPDSREAYARERAAHWRAQVSGAVQIGLRAATRLAEPAAAEEIVRLSVAHGLPSDLVRGVIGELQAAGASRWAGQLDAVLDLARR